MDNKHNISVMIGRFQPVHSAHIEIINQALELSDNIIIVIGSDNQPRTPKNPFTSKEREQMILASMPQDTWNSIRFARIEDATYNNQDWARNVQDAVDKTAVQFYNDWNDEPTFTLIGHHKDASSFYLDMFPQWSNIEIPLIDDLHSTDIRDSYFNKSGRVSFETLPLGVRNFLREFEQSDEFGTLREEYDYIEMYKEQWSVAPYAPTFVTVDAVVIQAGHVLLVKRRASPGKGLYALPGGFLDQNETLEDGMLRELREETKLKIPVPVLRGSIKKSRIFDAPQRSLRGRTITQAFLIELPASTPLPKVKGADDAEKAMWVPLNDFYKMQDKIFEDHWSIVKTMIGEL